MQLINQLNVFNWIELMQINEIENSVDGLDLMPALPFNVSFYLALLLAACFHFIYLPEFKLQLN